MKKIILITLAFMCTLLTKSQVTSITQLKDVKPEAAYYESLRYLIEDLGSVSGDSDGNFRPEKPVTKGYWAIVTEATFSRIIELIESSKYQITDSIKRDEFSTQMLLTMPTNFCNIKDADIRSTTQVKDIDEKAEYFTAVQSLVERYGLIWLKTTTSFAPDAPIEEAEFKKFFTAAFKASFETPSKGFLSRGDFIQYTAAWTKHFITQINDVIKEDNKVK